MSKQKSYLLQKLFHTKHTLIHTLLIIFLGLGIFGIIQNTKAQLSPAGFSVINTQFPLINKNTGNYITTGNFGTIKLGASGIIDDFRRNRNGINIKLYDIGINLIYFNNFDTQESLEENLVALADSVRDFPGTDFIGGIIGTGNNGWKYLYSSGNAIGYNIPLFQNNGEICQRFIGYLITDVGYLNAYGFNSTGEFLATNGMLGYDFTFSPAPITGMTCSLVPLSSTYSCSRTCIFGEYDGPYFTYIGTGIQTYSNATLYDLTYSGNLRGIGIGPILNHSYANISKYIAHPGSGTANSLEQLKTKNDIPIIWRRTSSISGSVKIINKLSDDDNNCGNGIEYTIYRGFQTGEKIYGLNIITGFSFSNNFETITIEKDINILSGVNLFFEIQNKSGDNECDGTRNHIQIYDITNGEDVSGPPIINLNGKYGGALEFDGTHQQYSLGTGVNQGTGITISAWIKTDNASKTQAIVTKKNAYGIILKNGKIRVSPSTYWMWHDTGIPVTTERTHITRTYDGQQMNVYKNGGSGNIGGSSWSYNIIGPLHTGNDLTFIGYDKINTGRGRDGLIDEIRMYNISITSGQAQQLYESNLKIVKGDDPYREFITYKTGLVDGEYDYSWLSTGILIETGNDLFHDDEIFNTIPTCYGCDDKFCDIGSISKLFFYYEDNFICKALLSFRVIPPPPTGGYDVYSYHRYIIGPLEQGQITIDSAGPIIHQISGTTGYESNNLTINISGTDTSGVSGYQRRWYLDGQRTNRTNWSMTSGFTILAKDEPTTGIVEVNVRDSVGWITNQTGIIKRKNQGPYLTGKTYISGRIEDELTFSGTAIDTGSNITYQWYLSGGGDFKIITGATGASYTTGRYYPSIEIFKLRAEDSQGARSGFIFTGEWNSSELYNNYLIRLLPNGNIDNFLNLSNSSFNRNVYSIVLDNTGNYIVGGYFTGYQGEIVNRIVKLTSTGAIDTIFGNGTSTGFNNYIRSIIQDSDGNYIVGGGFTTYQWKTVNNIVKLTSTGAIDTIFGNGTSTGFNNGAIYSIIQDNSGNYVVGGSFTGYQGEIVNRIVKLTSTGAIDTIFGNGTSTGFNDGTIYSIIQDNSGNYVVGGSFNSYQGKTVNNIVKLTSTGAIDTIFGNGTSTGFIRSIIQDSDGNYIVGGGFTTYQGKTVNNIVKLTSTGAIDTIFGNGTSTGFNNYVYSIIQDSGGNYLVGGNFTTYQGKRVNRTTRLTSTGIIDYSFNLNTIIKSTVQTINIDNDNKILIGGIFSGKQEAYIKNENKDIDGGYTKKIAIDGTITYSGTIGECTRDDNSIYYIGYSTGIGNDYCIIQQQGGQQIVLGWYGINRNKTFFILTGTRENPYLINPKSNQFIFEFQNTHLTGFKRAISGTNNTTTGTYNIFDQNLLGLYNFDKILLADSESDFMPIQSGKNRIYQRRPRGESEYTDLQYNNITKQRIIGATGENPMLFIDNKLINPGDLYGDAVIGRTSPVNAKILVEYYLELDPNSNQNCTGNGINYVFKKNTSIIQTGEILELSTIESAIKTIDIKKSDSLFFEIKSKGNNTCDVVLYDIKIYQLPETNIASGNQGTNIGANYSENGRYNGALEFFNNNQFVTIGAGVYAPQMSISLRAYKTSDNSPQTIIEKGGSYGLIISGNKLHIVDNYTLYNTQIEIPNYTWTHIGRSQDGQTAKVYINGKLQHNIPSLSNLVPNINSTQIGYLYPHGQRIGLLDEIYIYSGAISSGHFAALYEHNLNKIARDRWTWVSNTSGAINDGNFFFTGTSTSYNGSQRIQTGEFSRDFTPPEFSKRTWIMSGSQITGESITTGIIIFQNQSIVLSGAWLSGIGKAINIGSYEWDIDDNGSIDGTGNTIIIPFDGQYSRIIKRSVKDLAGNIGTQTGEIIWQNVIPPVFSGFIINGNTGNIITGNIEIQESNSATITRTGYDQNGLIQNGFEWTIRIPGTGDIVLTGQTGTITIPKWDEPVQGTIEVTAKNNYDFKTISTANLLRTNIGPELNDPKSEYTGLVEKPITFTITGFTDTGNNLEEFTYQRYSGHTCISGNAITGETNNTYSTIKNQVLEQTFSYQIFDKQGSGTCHNFTGIRESFEENDPTIIGNTGTGFNGGYTGQLEITGSMINSGTIGICSGDNNFTYYTGYTLPNPNTGIGNDYCIIQTGGNQIVLGWYGVNRNNTLFNLTGTTGNNYYTLSSKTNPFETKIQNTHLIGFKRSISGTNNTKTGNFNIFDNNLLGLYNFDEILLADSLEDFTPIQTGKNRSYFRRPLGLEESEEYKGLQYHPESQQRIVSNPIQEFDGLFISKNKINPGYNYGDAVLGRTSPVSADIKIELNLIDDNSTCGDGITYKLFNEDIEISSGTYGNHTINTSITKDNNLYLRINSNLDNDCDTTNYRIKIYQRPETNIANNVRTTSTFGINSGANYIQTGKFGGAVEFNENNKFINLGTGLHNTGAMSVSMRLYKTSDQANQTILIKTGSYGIAIFNNTLQVTNKTTQQRFDTQIEIPKDTWTHIGRSYDGSTIHIYINGKLEKSQGLQGSIAQSSNPTYIGYSPSNGQRNGVIDELYIYSGAISSGHFATLYEHNLNRTARDKRTWTSNTSGSINEGIFDFTGMVTSQNGTANLTGGEIRKDFNAPLFSGRSWEVNGNPDSTTGNTIEISGKFGITLSGIRDDKFGLGVDTGSYLRDIDDNGTIDSTQETITIPYQNGIESRIIKAIVEDQIGNMNTITGEIKRLDANPPTFSGFLGTTGFESEQLIVSRTGILPDPNTKIDWTITLPSSTITHENTGTTITIPAQDEPTTANISVKISDEYGFEMTNESTIQWINTGPTITDTVTEYSGVVEKLLVFNAAGIDTGSQLSYQRYNTGGCPINQTIIGATGETYSTRRDTPTTQDFSYQIFDSQESGSCHNFTGIRDNQVLKPLVPIYTTGINLNGNNTIGIDITGTTIIHPGTKGICTISGEQTIYRANPQTIGNDYCIIQTGSSVNSRVVLWFNDININKTFFSITGTLFQQQRLLSPISNPFNINIITNNLTGLTQTTSGTNNTNYINGNIYTGLLAMYNFDRILLADSQTDFMPIQTGKNRSYLRRPRGTSDFTDLQYDPVSQQRLVSRPIQEYDGMFIKSNTLNPGDDYGDIVLKRTSPFHANIEINFNISDAIASCGDGIKYEIIKGTTNIHSGSYGNYTIPTTISKSESLYFKINSSGNNLCDTTNYRIQIYQLPETNISQNQTLSTNSGAQYITQGKKGGAFSFTNNNQLIRLGTGLVNASGMSIAFWVNPENTNGNQTIIQKGASYGIALSSGTIYVTNKSTQQRFNTEITIEADKRTHIGRSYDSLNMKLYKNGKEVREKYIGGSIGGSTNNTIIAYSTEHGQFRGKIDELYIYNYVVPQQIIGLLHQYNFNKIGLYNRSLTENKDAFTNGGYDGKFNYYITGSNNSTGLNMLIDFNGPIISNINGLTGRESQNLLITGILYDSGSQFSGYQRRTIINETATIRSQRNNSPNFTITIPAQIETSTGILEIKTRDVFGHELISTNNISWQNTGPIISNNQVYEYWAKIGSNITFVANAIDEGSNLTYQRYSGHDCTDILALETNSTLTTGSNTEETRIYSFKTFDNYQEPSICVNLTGTWQNQIGFQNLTVYLTGDGKGGNITGNRNSLNGLWAGYSQTGDEIIVNGQKGICKLTGNKTEIIYTRKEERQGNDSCILKLDNNEYILLAFIDIHTGFLATRTEPFPEITSDKNFINLYSTIYIPEITDFIINRGGENTQGSGLINKTITGQDNNVIRKYSFDRILITDSTEDFGKFKNEYSWNYFRDNGTSTGGFTFSPRIQSRIINEPLQDYEYIFISSGEMYPGATKYGKIVYERTSNINGSIDIESQINNKNPGYCTNTDGIIYTIKKSDSYGSSNIIYSRNLPDLTENSTTETVIASGEKLYFIVDSKNNNQCDKISLNAKIYFNPIHDFSASGQTLQISGANYNGDGKYGGSYDFSTDQSFLNIGTINKGTGLTFSTRIKINGTSNQTILYKQGSYGLAIKDGSLKVTTDGGRWHNTNTDTTSKLTNGQRNHLLWTYDGTNMYVFVNGEQTRTNRIVGYYPTNSNATIIGRSTTNGQLNGSIDELHVRKKFITANEAKDIYNTHFRKLDGETWNFAFTQTGLADGIYTITGTINGDNIFTGKTIIDNNAPSIDFLGYTGNESENLNIVITGYDEGTSISGFTYRYKVSNTNSWSNTINRTRQNSTGNEINIEAQNEPTIGIIEITIRDESNNKKTYTPTIERLNVAIITEPLFVTGHEGSTITFTASGYDTGGTTNTGYQRYIGEGCINKIVGANQKTFATGKNEPNTVTFSYTMFDAQGLTGICSTATGIWQNTQPIAKDLYVNASGDYNITFNATGSDSGNTVFSGAWFTGNSCTGSILSTGLTFTTSSTKSGAYEFSYYLRDAQGATGVNNVNTGRQCQIATGYRPYLNPIANDFIISQNTTNKLATGDRKSSSQVKDPEYNTSITATISSGSKGYCQITNNRISFQPIVNNIGTGFCELTLTDGNDRSTIIKAYALNIDTTAPTTTITTGNYQSFELIYNDTSIGTGYYKTLIGVRNVNSCGTSGYIPYISGTTIPIAYTPGTTDYRTICYYSQDIYGNRENIKTQLFTQPKDAIPFNVVFSSNPFMNNIFEATITTNKNSTGTLTGLDGIKILSLTAGTHTITGNFTENNGQKTAYISLQTQNTGEIFVRAHTFTIDQTAPSTPVIIEQIENSNYYTIKRNPSTDEVSGIKGYNYEISNQYTKVKEGFTDVTYLNILKSEIQYNSWISIKVQSQDKVNNVSQRSSPISITIPQQQPQQTTIDTEPNQFAFTKTTNAKRNTTYTSNEIVIGGLSNNTLIPIRLSTGNLFINDSKISNNSGLAKNGDIIYIQLYSSEQYNESTHAILVANGISATYTITTEGKGTKSSTTSFLEELRKLLEQVQKEDTNNTNTQTTTDTTIDTKRVSAPHIAPNGKTYSLYKTIDGRYSSHNFVTKRYFTSLSEMKTYIDKNNPR